MSTMTAQETEVKIVDCDVHLVPRSKDELLNRMPAVLRDRLGSRRANNSSGKEGYAAFGPGRRMDSRPKYGPAGSDPDLVFRQLFDEAAVDLAILIPEMRYTVDPELNAALAHAFNAWVADTWLSRWNLGDRLYGTISVSMDDPARAVREIEEWADHPRFKQILISNYSSRPLGFPQFDMVWEAAARHRLPVAMHNTAYAAGAIGSTPTGRFQHWVDFHSLAFPLMYSAHLDQLDLQRRLRPLPRLQGGVRRGRLPLAPPAGRPPGAALARDAARGAGDAKRPVRLRARARALHHPADRGDRPAHRGSTPVGAGRCGAHADAVERLPAPRL